MQAAGKLIVFIGKLTARMQPAEDQLNRWHALFRVDVDRHPTTIVNDLRGLVGMKDNFHAFGVACQRFIHTVINNFLTKMVRTSGVGIHARTAAHRL